MTRLQLKHAAMCVSIAFSWRMARDCSEGSACCKIFPAAQGHLPGKVKLSSEQCPIAVVGLAAGKRALLMFPWGQVMDALAMTFPEGHFDLVWACESGEHMPDKKKYVQQMMRVLAPGKTPRLASLPAQHPLRGPRSQHIAVQPPCICSLQVPCQACTQLPKESSASTLHA